LLQMPPAGFASQRADSRKGRLVLRKAVVAPVYRATPADAWSVQGLHGFAAMLQPGPASRQVAGGPHAAALSDVANWTARAAHTYREAECITVQVAIFLALRLPFPAAPIHVAAAALRKQCQ